MMSIVFRFEGLKFENIEFLRCPSTWLVTLYLDIVSESDNAFSCKRAPALRRSDTWYDRENSIPRQAKRDELVGSKRSELAEL